MNPVRSVLSSLGLVALVLLGTACGDAAVVDPPVASIGDDEITQEELDAEIDAIRGNEEYLAALGSSVQIEGEGEGTLDADFVSRILTLQIYYELVDRELAERDAEVTPEELETARDEVIAQVGGEEVFDAFPADYQEEQVRRLAMVTKLNDVVGADFQGEGAAARFYEENPEALERRCLRHILVSTEDQSPEAALAEAEALQAQLEAGADFAALATASSDDPGSAQQGGALDCVAQGSFVPEFEEAAWELEVGEVSEPVQTQFGYHLIQVTDVQLPPLEEITEEVDAALAQAAQAEFTAWLQEATGEADVDVNPRYGEWVAGEEAPGGVGRVVPPEGAVETPDDAGATPAG